LSDIPPSFLTAVTAAAHPAFLGVQVQKGEVKLTAYNSIPCSSINLAARVLSKPPDNRPTALILARVFKESIIRNYLNLYYFWTS
jgi:hypothetical protein